MTVAHRSSGTFQGALTQGRGKGACTSHNQNKAGLAAMIQSGEREGTGKGYPCYSEIFQ